MKTIVFGMTVFLLLISCNITDLPDVNFSGVAVDGYYKNGKFYVVHEAEDVLIEMDFSGVKNDVPPDNTYTIGTDVILTVTVQNQNFDSTGTVIISNSSDANGLAVNGVNNSYNIEVDAECSASSVSLISYFDFKITGAAAVTQTAVP